MVELTRVITDQLGFHARPIIRISTEAARWQSDVTVAHGDKVASADDVMALMGLEAGCGDEIVVRVSGPDEEDAAEFIAHLMRDL